MWKMEPKKKGKKQKRKVENMGGAKTRGNEDKKEEDGQKENEWK